MDLEEQGTQTAAAALGVSHNVLVSPWLRHHHRHSPCVLLPGAAGNYGNEDTREKLKGGNMKSILLAALAMAITTGCAAKEDAEKLAYALAYTTSGTGIECTLQVVLANRIEQRFFNLNILRAEATACVDKQLGPILGPRPIKSQGGSK
jgi:hypothetical protein